MSVAPLPDTSPPGRPFRLTSPPGVEAPTGPCVRHQADVGTSCLVVLMTLATASMSFRVRTFFVSWSFSISSRLRGGLDIPLG